ncbi:hypothetical protein BJV78DRAFT_1226853 [Lactifluus subvellereus]|nr:hypothetical protein BJV78DRAFT_1226853 [Lactifluus subvellereus]
MTTKTSSNVQALYAHIHHLLNEHVAAHLTTNYVDCTQLRVYQALIDGLMPVAVDDPHSLVPPSDPLDDLVRKYCQIELKDTWEKLTAVKRAQELIHHTIKATPFETVLTTNFPDTLYFQVSDYVPDPSVLAVRSIQQTPRPGSNKLARFIPFALREVVSQNVRASVSEEVLEDDTGIQTKDVFHVRLTVDGHSCKEIMSLCQANPFSTRHTSGTGYPRPSPFLDRTPSPPLLAPCPQTPPLFSRITMAPGRPPHVPVSMSDLPLITPFANGDDDKETLEYAAAIDGWSEFTTSSPPTPSLDDRTSELHEIFAPSSDSPGPINDLLKTEMDMVHMPRQSGVRGSQGTLRVPGQGKLLHEYIDTIVDMTRYPKITTTPTLPPDDFALAHHVGAISTLNSVWQCSDDTEDTFFEHLTPDFPYGTIDSVLIEKSMDLGDDSMDVPPLPAPNVHSHCTVWPRNMSSLVTHKSFSAFYTVKGIKSPYSSEQTAPALEELVGVSELHYFRSNIYGDLEESKAQLAELFNQLDPLTHPISIGEENQRMLQASSIAPPKLNSVAVDLGSFDNVDSNRHRSRSLRGPRLERVSGRAGRPDGGGCTAQSQSSGQSNVGRPLEAGYCEQSTNYAQLSTVESGHMPCGHALPSEDVTLDAEIIVAPKLQLPMEPIITALPGTSSSSQDPALITGPESCKNPSPDWVHTSEASGLDLSLAGASFALAVCEEQSLRGYLSVLAKQSLLARPSHSTLTLPGRSEQRRQSTPPVDTEGLLRELAKLAAPLPPLEAPPCRNHRYLASVELLQDRPLTRALRLASLRIELLEREWLNGADLVFDCDTALVFAPLFQVLIPSSSRSLKSKLSSLSWRYTHIVVVFKLYGGVSGLQRPQDEEGQANLFARVIRFIKKIYRELALAEAYGTKRSEAVVQVYFVRSIEEAATAARLLGDIAESRSQFGPWDDRLWLGVDEQEEERYLSDVDGMNAFAAAAILSQISLRDFLASRADQRLQLALPISEDIIVGVNLFYSSTR